MGKTYDLMIRAKGDTRDADRAMKQLSRSISQTGKKVQNAGRMMAMGITAPIVGLGVMGARELGAIEKSTKQTDIALRRFGNGAKISSGFVADLAKALQRKSGLDDQAIQSGQNMLLTLGSIDLKTKAGAKTFKVASRSMVEFADSMGKDVTQAGALYAKTLAAASQGNILLPRGVKLSGDAMKQLEADMKKASTSTERQTLVLDAMQKKFAGGMDMTNSEKMAVAMDELAGVGAKLVTLLLPAFNVLVDKLKGLTTWFDSLSSSGQKFVGVGLGLAAALGPVLMVAGSLMQLFSGPLAAALAGISLPVVGVIAAVAALGVGLVIAYKKSERFRDAVNNAFHNVKNTVMSVVNSLRQTLTVWGGWLSSAWGKWGNDILGVVRPVFNIIRTIISTQVNNVLSIVKTVLALLRGDWSGAWKEIKSIVSRTWDSIKTVVSNGAKAVSSAVKSLASGLMKIGSELLNVGKKLGKKIIDGIKEGIKENAFQISQAVSSIQRTMANPIGGFGGLANTLKGGVFGKSGKGKPGAEYANRVMNSGGVNYFGDVYGANPSSGSIAQYFSMQSQDIYKVVSNNSGSQSLVTNQAKKSYVEAKIAAEKKKLSQYLGLRAKALTKLKTLRKSYSAALAALGKAKRQKNKKSIASFLKKVDALNDAIGEIEGVVEGYNQEILNLGGEIQNDQESLVAPDIDSTIDATTATITGAGGETTASVSTGSGADNAISQLQNSLTASQANLLASEQAFGYFNGTGDIGGGGFNALAAARGAVNVYFNSTVPYTQEQARMVALMAAQGIQSNGSLASISTNTTSIGA